MDANAIYGSWVKPNENVMIYYGNKLFKERNVMGKNFQLVPQKFKFFLFLSLKNEMALNVVNVPEFINLKFSINYFLVPVAASISV